MVNSLQEGQIRVELYPTTGKPYRVRQSKPSIMKETDKIMSDDITRWQLQFAKTEIVPKIFRLPFRILPIKEMDIIPATGRQLILFLKPAKK